MNLPASGETLALGDTALACCRQQLCPKFATQSDCSWISSGDLSWKEKLSDDLDKVQTIDHRLEDLRASDLNDPAAINEENILTVRPRMQSHAPVQRVARLQQRERVSARARARKRANATRWRTQRESSERMRQAADA